MEQGLTGVESRRCSAPSRGKAAARVVRRCGVRWGRRGVRLGLRRAGPGISACAPAGKVVEISGGRCGSAGKTELAAGPGPSAGLGSGRWQVGRRGSADARAEGGGRLVRGAARTWALASGVTRGRADVRAQAVSRGGERVRRGSRPGAGCWRGRAGPRLGRNLGRGVGLGV